MNERGLYDPGLQPERTALAWQRTVLALLVCSAASLRLFLPGLGATSLAIGVVGGAASAALWAASTARAGRAAISLRTEAALPGGLLLAIVAACAAGVAAVCLIAAVVRAI